MKRKIFSVILAFGLSLVMLTACGKTGDADKTAAPTDTSGVEDTSEYTIGEETGEPETAPAVEYVAKNAPTSYLNDDYMALADRWAGSDDSAVAQVMRKASRKEAVTVAVIGGSITQGTISNGSKDSEVSEKKMYAEIFHDWWVETYPDTEITFVNAGIGATDSYLGVHRVEKDVLAYNPDLVLVEFSVNDSGDNFSKTSYDNLIRKIATSDSKPAIMLLFMGQTNGSSAQDAHSLVGFNYQLPMLSYKNVIDAMIENGDYQAGELSSDTVHPSALGHRITGEIIWKYLNSIYEAQDDYGEPKPFDFSVNTVDKYAGHTAILDNDDIEPADAGTFEKSEVFYQFNNDWSTNTPGGEITFNISFKNLGILYYCQTNGKGATYDVIIDGNSVYSLNADFSGGWGNYAAAKEVFAEKESAEHTVTLRQKEGSAGDEFTLLGFLVTE